MAPSHARALLSKLPPPHLTNIPNVAKAIPLGGIARWPEYTEKDRQKYIYNDAIKTHYATRDLIPRMSEVFKEKQAESILRQISRAHDKHFLFGRTTLGRDVRTEFYTAVEEYALEKASSKQLDFSQIASITRSLGCRSATEVHSPRKWFSWLEDELKVNHNKLTSSQISEVAYSCAQSKLIVRNVGVAVKRLLHSLIRKQSINPEEVKLEDVVDAVRAFYGVAYIGEADDEMIHLADEAFMPFMPGTQYLSKWDPEFVIPPKARFELKTDHVAMLGWTMCVSNGASQSIVPLSLHHILEYLDISVVKGSAPDANPKESSENSTNRKSKGRLYHNDHVYGQAWQIHQSLDLLNRFNENYFDKSLYDYMENHKDLLEALRLKTTQAKAHRPNVSEKQLFEVVKQLELGTVVEQYTLANGYTLDVCVPERQMAFEFQGPTHFATVPYMTGERWATAPLHLKHRLLTSQGWHVTHINYWEWNALRLGERLEYVQDAMERDDVPSSSSTAGLFYESMAEPLESLDGFACEPEGQTLWSNFGNFSSESIPLSDEEFSDSDNSDDSENESENRIYYGASDDTNEYS
eukprot:CFRG7042T1